MRAALGWIVGFLKARTGAHEVIVTIMLNYVMAYLLSYLLSKPLLLEKPGANGNLISPRSRATRISRCWPARTCASTPASCSRWHARPACGG